jgi:U3 small nucleolar RNA-associated protein 3
MAPELVHESCAAQAIAGVHSERVAKDTAGLSRGERADAVLRDAPELTALVRDMAASFGEVRARNGPLLAELRGGGFATDAGMSYLEAKHMLLLTYCINSLFYVLLKLEGQPVRDHPVVTRLVAAKAYLEKLRPVDKKLKTQVEKLLRAAELAATGGAAEVGAPPLPGSPQRYHAALSQPFRPTPLSHNARQVDCLR